MDTQERIMATNRSVYPEIIRPAGSSEDERLALEIAEFVAERAQHFADHECRAWAFTDFGVWAVLAGQSPKLAMEPEGGLN